MAHRFKLCNLHNVNIVNSPSCHCGFCKETAYHFFFECPKYDAPRRDLLEKLNTLLPIELLNLKLLLNGNESLSQDKNQMIVTYVHEFIKKSKRFLVV